jgi:hypothetical protein
LLLARLCQFVCLRTTIFSSLDFYLPIGSLLNLSMLRLVQRQQQLMIVFAHTANTHQKVTMTALMKRPDLWLIINIFFSASEWRKNHCVCWEYIRGDYYWSLRTQTLARSLPICAQWSWQPKFALMTICCHHHHHHHLPRKIYTSKPKVNSVEIN